MTYKLAICDDETSVIEYISSIVTAWATEYQHEIQLRIFSSAENFLFSYEDENDFDILLLDVEMGQMDGVSLAKTIRKNNKTVQIVFITGYSDYIAEGYEVSALHYLMKPVKQEKLFEVLNRATEKLEKNERLLTLELSGEMIRIPLHEIRYLDVNGNYVTIHGKADYTVKKTLGEMLKELDERFFKVGRSCIVNLNTVQRITKTDCYLSDGSILPLPRGAYESLNRAIIMMS
ncbi:MAG: response regulator transcription factor [Agathobacter sp.]|nr:response regulator transcription factor [Agathobacter sp.]